MLHGITNHTRQVAIANWLFYIKKSFEIAQINTLETFYTLTAQSLHVGCSQLWYKIYCFVLLVIHSMNKFFTTIDFHDDVIIWNYHLVIVVHSGSMEAIEIV